MNEQFWPRRRLALLLLTVTPLLMAVSCREPQPPPFETSHTVIRGDWGGKIRQAGEVVVEFRLEDVQAQRTGSDSYSFEGDAYFGLQSAPGGVVGTGTVDPPFAASHQSSSAMAAQMGPPKGARYSVTAKLTEPDGDVWDLDAVAYELQRYHDGDAVGPLDQDGTVSFAPIGPMPHVMGFAAQPPEIQSGDAYEVVWAIWTDEERASRCRLELPSQADVQVSDCATGAHRISSSFPDIDPEPSEPVSFPIELTVEWGDDFEHWATTSIELVLLPKP